MRTTPLRAALAAALVLTVAACDGMVEVRPTATVELDPPVQSSRVLAADGSVLAELHAEIDRVVVELDEVAPVLAAAVVAVEDTRFYEHPGVDGRAVARAAAVNASEGQVAQGGSTITQQLAKVSAVGDEQSLRRKLAEASVALQLEQQLSKDQILEHYLNAVYLGNGAYGVQAAAQRYFGVDAADVDAGQAALLAGLIRAPNRYDPHARPDAARGRRDVVAGIMAREGVVTSDEADAIRSSDVAVIGRQLARPWTAPHFVAEVLVDLTESPDFALLGDDAAERADLVHRGGLTIETTLDPAWQRAAETAIAAVLTEPGDPAAAAVVIDPPTGAVRALVGGQGWDDADDPAGRYNLATQARRQPGSTFKSLVLAAAVESGVTLDEPFDGGASVTIPADPPAHPEPWVVTNAGGADFLPLSLGQATTWSANVVYAQLIDRLGPEAVADMATAAGIGRPLPPLRSLALGAVEVSPLELASVQATLAAGGLTRSPALVERVTAADGRVLYERRADPGRRAMSASTAWVTTTALEEVVTDGTGRQAAMGRPVAGKTGTSNDHADAWFAGYTPDLAAAVWVGFPEGRVPMQPPTTRRTVEGGTWPAEIFARMATEALAGVAPHDFAVPDDVLITLRVDAERGCVPGPYTPRDVLERRDYVDGSEPTAACEDPAVAPVTDVPSVGGFPVEVATQLLDERGFDVEVRDELTAAAPPGTVVRQDPAPGPDQELAAGWRATVWVAAGVESEAAGRVVPDVVGATAAEASAALEAAGLSAEVIRTCPGGGGTCTGARERPGRVWEQVPDAGSRLPDGEAVRVSAYPG